MKIEKINDNQIRCTLTKEDLIDRELKLSELAYGTDKAKSLFRDMMQQAAYEFGFEANDIPLMIEAIPVSQDSIILIITKVEDPEELDTRFAKFAPTDGSETADAASPASPSKLEGADDILSLFKKIQEAKKSLNEKTPATGTKKKSKKQEPVVEVPYNLTKLYKFPQLDSVIRVAGVLNGSYDGYNSLYKDDHSKTYHLIISKSDHTPEEFNKICNILSEYGMSSKYSAATEAFYTEHMEQLIAEDALQKLALL